MSEQLNAANLQFQAVRGREVDQATATEEFYNWFRRRKLMAAAPDAAHWAMLPRI